MNHQPLPAIRVAIALLTVCIAGCAAPPPPEPSNEPRGPRPPGSGLLFEKAELETPQGETAMEFVVKGDEVNLYDGQQVKIASYRVGADEITFTAELLRVTGTVQRGAEGFTVETRRASPLVLTGEPDGDLLLYRDGSLLFELKKRDYGYKIVDPANTDLGRVRKSPNRIKVRDAKRQDVRVTKAPISTAAVACWLLPGIEPHEAAAFTLAITMWGMPE